MPSTSTRHDQFMTETAYGFSFPKEALGWPISAYFWLGAVQLLLAPLCASNSKGISREKRPANMDPNKTHYKNETIYGLKWNYFDKIGFHLKCHFVSATLNGLSKQLHWIRSARNSFAEFAFFSSPSQVHVVMFILSCMGINAAQLSFEGGQLARKLLNKSFQNDNGTCNSIAINVYTYLRAFSFCVFCALSWN